MPSTTERTTLHLAQLIIAEVNRVRRMNGYTEGSDTGTDAGIWLGASLHRIEDCAGSIIAAQLATY